MATSAHVPNGAGGPETNSVPTIGESAAISQLKSSEQRDLLDAIDKLRRAHIPGTDLSIPQIVVCGDQSSGKSSVLGAIAQVVFPVGIGTKTKFATEVVLRNDSSPAASPVNVHFHPASDRTLEQKRSLETFRVPVDVRNAGDLSKAVDAASKYLEEQEPQRKFWYDQLQVEVSGAAQPHLTLVDLPGLIQTESGNTNPGDKDKIKKLVKEYISNPRTIVLAVVNSSYDIDNQEIIQLVRDTGNAKERTIGVLTKPDRLDSGSDEEKRAIQVASNDKLRLGLGWHVLRNLSNDREQEKDQSYATRDETERTFFSTGGWAKLNRKDVGIVTLREKLSVGLMDCITRDLPTLLDEMQRKLSNCETRLTELGTARDSLDAQREYLAHIQAKLQRLIEAALDGGQVHSEFEAFFDGSQNKGLRTMINRESDAFASRMRNEGKQYHIFDKFEELNTQFGLVAQTPKFYPPYQPNSEVTSPSNISLRAYCTPLGTFMDETRGKGLPRLLTSGTIQAIFRQQSIFWQPISLAYLDQCYAAAFEFVKAAVFYVAGRYTGEKLLEQFIHDSFDSKYTKLKDKLKELLWPYQKSHPVTYNPKYSARLNPKSLSSSEGDSDESSTLWANVARELRFEDNLVFAAEALDKAEVYYELALDTFVENVAILGVEAVLLSDLSTLISAGQIFRLTADQVMEIAAERPEAQEERESVRKQIATLDDVIRICKRHARAGRTSTATTNAAVATNGLRPDRSSTYASNKSPGRSGPHNGGGAADLSGQKKLPASPFSPPQHPDRNNAATTPAPTTKEATTSGASVFGGFGQGKTSGGLFRSPLPSATQPQTVSPFTSPFSNTLSGGQSSSNTAGSAARPTGEEASHSHGFGGTKLFGGNANPTGHSRLFGSASTPATQPQFSQLFPSPSVDEQKVNNSTGRSSLSFFPYTEKDSGSASCHYQSVAMLPKQRNQSFEVR